MGEDPTALKPSGEPNNQLLGCCHFYGILKELLEILMIIMNIIQYKDKLLTAKVFREVRSTEKIVLIKIVNSHLKA